jgi:large subunit ribosomal protein L1
MGSKKNVDMTQKETEIKIVEAESEVKEEGEVAEAVVAKKPVKAKKVRGKKYQAVRSKLDKAKFYPVAEAVELVKKLSYTKFVGSVEAHVIIREIGDSVGLALPHSTGQTVKVTIIDAEVLSKIEAGDIEGLGILIAHPEFMPKLAKFARVLGPKGLMPNPKNGTLTPNPELKKKELEAGKFNLKTEKKAPLMHLIIGKTDMKSSDLVENVEALVKALKGRILKLSLAPSMGPGIKVLIEEKEEE